MKYSVVIFDLDGTLLDTLDDLRDSVNHALGLFGMPEQSADEVRSHVGNGSARLLELSIPGGRANPDYDAVLETYSRWYDGHCRIKTRPYAGIPEILTRLNAAGVRCCIVSNKPDGAVKTLEHEFFSGLMAAAVGEKAGIRRKPAPDTVLAAIREVGSCPAECVYVGDTEVDIATAKNAGIPCISVAWGFRSADSLAESGAHELAVDAEELWRLLTE